MERKIGITGAYDGGLPLHHFGGITRDGSAVKGVIGSNKEDPI